MKLFHAPRETRIAAINMFENMMFRKNAKMFTKRDIVGKRLPGGEVFFVENDEKKSIFVKEFKVTDFDYKRYKKHFKSKKESRQTIYAQIFWNIEIKGLK